MCMFFGYELSFASFPFFNNNNNNNNALDEVRKVRIFRLVSLSSLLFKIQNLILPIVRQKIRFEILLYSYTPQKILSTITPKNSYLITILRILFLINSKSLQLRFNRIQDTFAEINFSMLMKNQNL